MYDSVVVLLAACIMTLLLPGNQYVCGNRHAGHPQNPSVMFILHLP